MFSCGSALWFIIAEDEMPLSLIYLFFIYLFFVCFPIGLYCLCSFPVFSCYLGSIHGCSFYTVAFSFGVDVLFLILVMLFLWPVVREFNILFAMRYLCILNSSCQSSALILLLTVSFKFVQHFHFRAEWNK